MSRWEWYYKPSSYISIGFFDKQVTNFVGIGTQMQNLFGLRDASAAGPGRPVGGGQERPLRHRRQSDRREPVHDDSPDPDHRPAVSAATAQYQAHRIASGDLDRTYADQSWRDRHHAERQRRPLQLPRSPSPIPTARPAKIHGFRNRRPNTSSALRRCAAAAALGGLYDGARRREASTDAANPDEDQFALCWVCRTRPTRP
ncbi:hypothetical protein ACRAWD_03425 [Caulobacter segnis]